MNFQHPACHRIALRNLAVMLLSGASLLPVGCGSNAPATSNAEPVASESKSKGDSKPRKGNDAKSAKGSSGQKMVDGIPYDVFFDKPLVIAANAQTGATVTADTNSASKGNDSTSTPAAEGSPAKDPTKGTPAGAVALKDLVDKESLANEIKSIRNYLAGKVASPATYNASYLEIPPEAATLAVMAVAVSKYPEDFSWKKNAKHVRDLAAKILELTTSKDAKTKNSFEAVTDAFTKIDDILKGSEPAGLASADEEKSFGDAVGGNTVILMKRISKSETFLKSTVSNEGGLKKEADRVAQEGAVLAFLAHIISSEGFGWDGDAEFASYSKPLFEGGKQLMEAAKSGNYALYGEAMTRVSKSCNDCHPKFKP